MARNKSVERNYLFNLGYQILLIIIPLITTPYLSRVLGAEGIGQYSFAESCVTYFVLFAVMGVSYYGQREIAFLQDDREKRTELFWNTKFFTLIVSLIAIIGYVLFASFQVNKVLYLILGINISNVIFDISWMYQGMEEFGKITIRNAIFKILNVIFIFMFVKEKTDVSIYAFGTAFFAMLGNCSMWFGVHNYVDFPDFHNTHPFREAKEIFSLFIPTIAIQIYTVLDKTMIGVITNNDAQNGYYDQAIRLSKIVLTLVTALGTVMISKIGYHYKKKDYDLIVEYMYRGYNFVWFLGCPLCFGLMGIASNVVPWFYGEGFEEVIPLIHISSFLILAIGINNVTGIQYLIPTERQNIFTKTVVIGAIVNFCINIVLIPKFQAIGAAVSSVIAETVIAAMQIYIVRKEINPFKVIFLSWKYLIAGLIMFFVLEYEETFLTVSIFSTVIMILSGAVCYLICLVILRDEFLLKYCRKTKL